MIMLPLSLLILSSLIVSVLSESRALKGSRPEDTVGFHETGKYMVFGTYSDTACSSSELMDTHGYALGVCQPFVVPGLWWMNYAGSSSKNTFLMYQFFQDADCSVPASGEVFPGLPATGHEGWDTGCNNRTVYSKSFRVQDKLPSFSEGTLILQYPTEEACKANKIRGATGFMLAKKNKCVYIQMPSMFVGGYDVPMGAYGMVASCSPNGAVTSKVYTDPSTCAESSYSNTYSFNKTDFCVPNKSAAGDILGYVNVKCI